MVGWDLRTSLLAVALVAVAVTLAVGADGVTDRVGGEPDGEEALERMLEYDEHVEDVYAEVTVSYEDASGSYERYLRMWDRPGSAHHRFETVESEFPAVNETVHASNGSVAWNYDQETGEATRYELGETRFVYPHADVDRYADVADDLAVEYRGTETVADREAHVVSVRAADDAEPSASIDLVVGGDRFRVPIGEDADEPYVVDAHFLWIDAETWYPLKERSVLRGPDDETVNTTTVHEAVSFDERHDDETFSFDPPADAEVTDVHPERLEFDSIPEAERSLAIDLPDAAAIPDRFAFEAVRTVELDGPATRATVVYADGDERLRIAVTDDGFDVDRGIAETVGGHEASIVRTTTGTALTWNCDETGYRISGDLDDERRHDVADSIATTACG